jgi:PAS domain S-box-containing protein
MNEKHTFEDKKKWGRGLEAPSMAQRNVEKSHDPASSSFFLVDPSGKILYAGEVGSECLGDKPVEFSRATLKDIFPPEIAQKRLLIGVEALKTGKPQKIEECIDGKWYSSTLFPMKDEHSGQERVAIFSVDITEQKRTERALRDSEEKYRRTFESITDSITVTRVTDGLYLYVNDGFCEQTGYLREEVLGKTPSDINLYANSGERERFIEILKRDGRAQNVVVSFRRKSGEVYCSEFSAKPITYAGEDCLLAQSRDITDRKNMLEKLEQSEEKYRAIFENKGTASGIFGEDGIILECNVIFEELSGYGKAEIIDKMKWSDFVVPEDLERLLNYDARRSKEGESPPAQYECRIKTKAGEKKTVIVNLNLVGSHRIVTLTDITDRRQAEKDREKLHAQLLQAQKMESIGTLAGGIAHDFNNILSAILGYSELALMDLPPESPLGNKLKAIYSSGAKARDLVTQILAVSRNDKQVSSPIDLHFAVEDALKLLRHAIPTTISIETEIDSDCRIMGDLSRIEQVIMNLCTNAYQAMLETGGTLKISLSRTEMEGKSAELAGIPSGIYGKLTVSDTGVGIASEQLDRIYEPYFTTKEKGKGTGLGLAVVHGIVKSHKGAIFVKSQVGKGTQFDIYLPLTMHQSVEIQKPVNTVKGGSESIMIVDDQDDVLEVETQILKALGYTVKSMNSAQEALNHFAKHSNQYDLVITDMTMPEMTGDRLAEQLRLIRPDILVVLATGFSDLISKEKAKSIGINGFLTKPVKVTDMANMIRQVLDGDSR